MKSAQAWKMLAAVATFIYFFNQLPLSAGAGLAAASMLIVLAVTAWPESKQGRWLVLGSLAVIIVAQAWSVAALPYGWSICLQRENAKETLLTPCEPSAAWRNGERTFIVPDIAWAENFIPLYFMNDKQAFNYYKDDEPDRKHLSYSLQAETFTKGGVGQVLTGTTSLPAVAVTVDGKVYNLTVDNPLTVALPEKKIYHIEAAFTHTRTSHDGLTLHTSSLPFYRLSADRLPSLFWYWLYITFVYGGLLVLFATLSFFSWRALTALSANSRWTFLGLLVWLAVFWLVPSEGWLWAALLFGLVICFFLARSPVTRRMITPALIVLGFHILRSLATSQPLEEVFLPFAALFIPTLLLIAFFGVTVPAADQSRLRPWLLLLLLINAWVFIQHTHPYGQLVLFTGGDDELTHEGFARQALLATNWPARLAAGEATIFYYQPFYRYFVAGIHALWGESMFGLYVVQTFLLSATVYATLRLLHLFRLPYAPLLFGLGFAAVSLLPNQSLLMVMQRPFQQGLGTPLLLIATAITFSFVIRPPSWRLLVATGVLWGVTLSIRTDYVPLMPLAIVAVVVGTWSWGRWRQRLAALLLFLIAASIFPALVVWRNYLVAGVPAFMPTSGLYNLADPYGSLFTGQNLKEISSSQALLTILAHYRSSLGELSTLIVEQIRANFVTTVPIRQVVWYSVLPASLLALLLVPAWRQRLVVLLLVAAPVSLLAPNVFFVQHNGVAMLGQYDYFFLALLALGVAAGIQRRFRPE